MSLEAVSPRSLATCAPAIEESGRGHDHDQLPTVRGDESQLAQLFQNLIGNAIKFRATRRRASTSAAPRATANGFAVRDNGIGIEPQYFERIFLIFQRLHGAGEYPGTGIGLAICKKIVERHGGRIWVESEPAQGSTFHFTLPGEARSRAEDDAERNNGPPVEILLVEDNPGDVR